MNFKISKQGVKKGTFLFLHGNSSSSNHFVPLFESNLNTSLLAFDFFGYGKSPKSENRTYDIESYKSQIMNEISDINDEIIIFGHSLGGHLALEVAHEVNNLKGIVIAGTPPLRKPLNFGEAFLPITETGVLFTDSATEEQINSLFELFLYNKSVFDLVKNDYLITDPNVRTDLAAVLQSSDSLADEVEVLKNLDCNKYVIHTEYEKAVNYEYLKSLQREVNFQLIDFPDSGHYLSLENPSELIYHLEKIAGECFK